MTPNPELPSLPPSKPKSQALTIALAFAGLSIPGLHKFYLKKPVWGTLYLLFFMTGIPQVASAIEGVWFLSQDQQEFDERYNPDLLPGEREARAGTAPRLQEGVTAVVQNLRQLLRPSQNPVADPERVSAIADALRQLDSLRQEGLISEYEFEQKRRQLLE
jgi:TM2 domain-containing membrane protein YozV